MNHKTSLSYDSCRASVSTGPLHGVMKWLTPQTHSKEDGENESCLGKHSVGLEEFTVLSVVC